MYFYSPYLYLNQPWGVHTNESTFHTYPVEVWEN